jgi:hypothetical protein
LELELLRIAGDHGAVETATSNLSAPGEGKKNSLPLPVGDYNCANVEEASSQFNQNVLYFGQIGQNGGLKWRHGKSRMQKHGSVS